MIITVNKYGVCDLSNDDRFSKSEIYYEVQFEAVNRLNNIENGRLDEFNIIRLDVKSP